MEIIVIFFYLPLIICLNSGSKPYKLERDEFELKFFLIVHQKKLYIKENCILKYTSFLLFKNLKLKTKKLITVFFFTNIEKEKKFTLI